MRPEAPLAGVERALPRVHRARVPVGHDHLAHRGPVDDGPHPPAVLVADGVEDQALQGVHADAQRPLLPAHEVALHLEARALGLGDLQRLEVGAQRPVVLGVVAPRLGRERARRPCRAPRAPRPGPCRRRPAGPRAGGRSRCPPWTRAGRPGSAVMRRPSLVAQPEGAGRPGVDLDQGTVDDAPPVEGGVPFGVLVQGGQHAAIGLLHLQRWADVLARPPSESTSPRVTETIASTTSASGPSRSTRRTRRSTRAASGSPSSTARTTSLGGSHRPT